MADTTTGQCFPPISPIISHRGSLSQGRPKPTGDLGGSLAGA
jgi:hypothetical protein